MVDKPVTTYPPRSIHNCSHKFEPNNHEVIKFVCKKCGGWKMNNDEEVKQPQTPSRSEREKDCAEIYAFIKAVSEGELPTKAWLKTVLECLNRLEDGNYV
jgi:hypothetical protein